MTKTHRWSKYFIFALALVAVIGAVAILPHLLAAASDETGTWGTCPYTYTAADGVLTIGAGEFENNASYSGNTFLKRLDPKKIIFTGTVKLPTNAAYLFSGLANLTLIEGGNNLDTSAVQGMGFMFDGCSKLTAVDVSNWDVSHVDNMDCMFRDCSSLTTLAVSKWNTAAVQSMYFMFVNCSKLKTLNVSNWDTSALEFMALIFSGCSSLQELDVSNWDVSQVSDFAEVFEGCSSLKTLDLSKWNTRFVGSFASMFRNCSSLKTLNLTNWITNGNIENEFSNMFDGCSSLTSLDLSTWNLSQAYDMQSMFKGCISLTSLDLSAWDTPYLHNVSSMFMNCSALSDLNISGLDFGFVTNMSNMFYNCSALKTVNLLNADFSKVTNANAMFFGTKLESISMNASLPVTLYSAGLPNPSATDFPGATGKWKNADTNAVYATNEIPTNTTATYVVDYAPVGNVTVVYPDLTTPSGLVFHVDREDTLTPVAGKVTLPDFERLVLTGDYFTTLGYTDGETVDITNDFNDETNEYELSDAIIVKFRCSADGQLYSLEDIYTVGTEDVTFTAEYQVCYYAEPTFSVATADGTVSVLTRGDVNNDGYVDFVDKQILTLIGDDELDTSLIPNYSAEQTDVTGDGELTEDDWFALMTIIGSRQGTSVATFTPNTEGMGIDRAICNSDACKLSISGTTVTATVSDGAECTVWVYLEQAVSYGSVTVVYPDLVTGSGKTYDVITDTVYGNTLTPNGSGVVTLPDAPAGIEIIVNSDLIESINGNANGFYLREWAISVQFRCSADNKLYASASTYTVGSDDVTFTAEYTIRQYVEPTFAITSENPSGGSVSSVFTPGDVNDDGFVDFQDVVFLWGLCDSTIVEADIPNYNAAQADVNGDAVINDDDITLLQQGIISTTTNTSTATIDPDYGFTITSATANGTNPVVSVNDYKVSAKVTDGKKYTVSVALVKTYGLPSISLSEFTYEGITFVVVPSGTSTQHEDADVNKGIYYTEDFDIKLINKDNDKLTLTYKADGTDFGLSYVWVGSDGKTYDPGEKVLFGDEDIHFALAVTVKKFVEPTVNNIGSGASAYSIFTPLDVDDDGDVDFLDVMYVNWYSAFLLDASDIPNLNMKQADYNHDGQMNTTDTTYTVCLLAGMNLDYAVTITETLNDGYAINEVTFPTATAEGAVAPTASVSDNKITVALAADDVTHQVNVTFKTVLEGAVDIPVDEDCDGDTDKQVPAVDPDDDGIYTDVDNNNYIPVDNDGNGVIDNYVPLDDIDPKTIIATDVEGNDYIPVDTNDDGKNEYIKVTNKNDDGSVDAADGKNYVPVDDDLDGVIDRYVPVSPKPSTGELIDSDGTIFIPVDEDSNGTIDAYVPAADDDDDGIYTDDNAQNYIPVDNDRNGVIDNYVPLDDIDEKTLIATDVNNVKYLPLDTNDDDKNEYVKIASTDPTTGLPKDDDDNTYIPVDEDCNGSTDAYVPATDDDGDGIYTDDNNNDYIPVDNDGDGAIDNYVPLDDIDPKTIIATDVEGNEYIPVDTNDDDKNEYIKVTNKNTDGVVDAADGKKYIPMDDNDDGVVDEYVEVKIVGGVPTDPETGDPYIKVGDEPATYEKLFDITLTDENGIVLGDLIKLKFYGNKNPSTSIKLLANGKYEMNAGFLTTLGTYVKKTSDFDFDKVNTLASLTNNNGVLTVTAAGSTIVQVKVSYGSVSQTLVVVIPGDVNYNGSATSTDVFAIRSYGNDTVNSIAYKPYYYKSYDLFMLMADVNSTQITGKLTITSSDANLLASKIG